MYIDISRCIPWIHIFAYHASVKLKKRILSMYFFFTHDGWIFIEEFVSGTVIFKQKHIFKHIFKHPFTEIVNKNTSL